MHVTGCKEPSLRLFALYWSFRLRVKTNQQNVNTRAKFDFGTFGMQAEITSATSPRSVIPPSAARGTVLNMCVHFANEISFDNCWRSLPRGLVNESVTTSEVV
jgi:hypothetical protein